MEKIKFFLRELNWRKTWIFIKWSTVGVGALSAAWMVISLIYLLVLGGWAAEGTTSLSGLDSWSQAFVSFSKLSFFQILILISLIVLSIDFILNENKKKDLKEKFGKWTMEFFSAKPGEE